MMGVVTTLEKAVGSIHLDKRAMSRKRQVALQALLAACALGLVLLLEHAFANLAIVTAIAATVFLVFVHPSGTMAQPQRILGGHVVAVVLAGIVSALLYEVAPASIGDAVVARDVAAATAVGLSIFVMAITNAEHPPAAGTALGLVLDPWSLSGAAAILIAAMILAFIRVFLAPKLMDLV